MIEVRDAMRELHRVRLRLALAWGLVLLCFLVLLTRFVWLQVVRHADLRRLAEDNRIALLPIAPSTYFLRKAQQQDATKRSARSR